MAERFSERVVVYVTPSVKERLDRAINTSDLQQPEWLRQVLEDSLERIGREGIAADVESINENGDSSAASQLAAAQASLEGQEEMTELLRERLRMADSQNGELNERLQEAHSAIDRMTRTLPESGEKGAAPRRSGWRFWSR